RRPAGADGAELRAGWVVVGRGGDAHAAAAAAERAADALAAVVSGLAAVVAATEPASLLDLVRPACAPLVRAVRRERWRPPLALRRGGEGGTLAATRGVVLPWPAPAPRWGEI